MKLYLRVTAGLIGVILSQSNVGAGIVPLGSADSFAVLGGTTVTSTGTSSITGDLGVSPGSAITGFPPGVVSGIIHANDASAISAHADAQNAYNLLGLLGPTSDLTGQDLGQTLTPGIYKFDSSAALTGDLILDGPGDFVFLIGTTLTTSSFSTVTLINGADAADVFFGVGSSATLGTSSMFTGTIIANISITATTGASIEGRLMALTAAVTLDNNKVFVPEPSSTLGLLMGMGLLLLRRRP